MNKLVALILLVALAAGAFWLRSRPAPHTFHIDHLNDSGAFRGRLEGSYYREGDALRVHIDQWTVRFGVGNQPGRQLDALFVELGVQSPEGYWSRQIKSDRSVMNRYVRAGEDLVLRDLTFTIPVGQDIWTQRTWIVAAYENSSSGRVGWNYGHDTFYLFSTQHVSHRSGNE